MARLLIVEDDPEVAEMIQYTLSGEGHEVRHVNMAEPAISEFEVMRPDLVILDVSLPDRSGLDVCAAIRARSRVPVLFVTARSLLQDKVRGFSVGGDDYIVKPFLPTELIMRVEALLRRSAWAGEQTKAVSIGDLEIDAAAGVVRRGGELIHLSRMEVDILAALASTPGTPWSPERLARRLGLPADSPAEAADLVYVKVSRLRRKMEPKPRKPQYVVNRRGAGYLLTHP